MKTKLLLFGIILLAAASCKKSDKSTTYQITNNMTKETVSDLEPLLNGSLYEVIVFEFNDKDEVVKQENISKIESGGGKSEIIEVTPDVVKVKVSFKMLPKESAYYNLSNNVRKYVKAYSYLPSEQNTNISIDGNTMVSSSMTATIGSDNFKLKDFEIIENNALK